MCIIFYGNDQESLGETLNLKSDKNEIGRALLILAFDNIYTSCVNISKEHIKKPQDQECIGGINVALRKAVLAISVQLKNLLNLYKKQEVSKLTS